MSDDIFIGEIRMFGFGYPPQTWALCNGQLLQINQNQALFSLLGTTYGGNGQTTFALPNLQGRVPVHAENGISGLGEQGGEVAHTITLQEMPTHTHQMMAKGAQATLIQGNIPANTKSLAQAASANTNPPPDVNLYATGNPAATMSPASVTNTGGSQAHNNMMPYLTINFCIALVGIFPSRN